jgi:hypothetical protein
MAVAWGLVHRDLKGVTSIGIDEICWKKIGSKFLTLVYQIDTGCKKLLWIGKDRTKVTLESFFDEFGADRSSKLRFVCTDMWKSYLQVVGQKAAKALNVLDRFHIMSHMNKVIDKVRATEARTLKAKGQEPVLNSSRWCLLKRPENLTEKQTVKLNELLAINLKTVQAYLLKEDFQRFWSYKSTGWAARFLDDWCKRTMRSRIDPMKKIARMLRAHRGLILNWFRAKEEIALGAVEGLNNKAKVTTKKAYGFKSIDVVKVALYHTLGKLPEPKSNRRFQNLASHYLFEPVACTPGAGWEKGQVENQVGVVRNRIFVKRRRFTDLEELNEWLEAECRNHALTARHPECKDRTVEEVFAEEKGHLLSLPVSPFDGYQETVARVSSQLLIGFDRNRYSVNAVAVRKTVTIRAYADRIIIVLNDRVVGMHRRHLGRNKVIYDPWHYLAVQKPGALRNGAPFKRWDLPAPVQEIRSKLEGHSDGDRQFVEVLSVVGRYGLDAVTEACAQALSDKTVSSDVILAILSRTQDEPQPEPVQESAKLPQLTLLPIVDCSRYDLLLSGGAHGTA